MSFIFFLIPVDEYPAIEFGHIVGLTDVSDSFGVNDLMEILSKIRENHSLSLRDSRPIAFNNWFKVRKLFTYLKFRIIILSFIHFIQFHFLLQFLSATLHHFTFFYIQPLLPQITLSEIFFTEQS